MEKSTEMLALLTNEPEQFGEDSTRVLANEVFMNVLGEKSLIMPIAMFLTKFSIVVHALKENIVKSHQ